MASPRPLYTSCWIIAFFLGIFFIYTTATGELHCFKRIHRTKEGSKSAVCRGLLSKPRSSGPARPFRSPRGCCRKGGAGYTAGPLVRIGKRKLKYPCSLCRDNRRGRPPTTPAPKLLTTSIYRTAVGQVGWSEWGAWGTCSTSCRVGVKVREKTCHSGCGGSKTVITDSRPCVITPDCPIDGSWGPWDEWSGCSSTCGGGNRTRSRRCNDPEPEYNGLDCPGPAVEAVDCQQASCPVNGNWSEWSVGVCSTTCGNHGIILRNRSCDNPAPKANGSRCEGPNSFTVACPALPKCPIHGGLSLWSDWSSCNATCDAGSRARTRGCFAPRPRRGGNNCTGETEQEQTCHSIVPCPVNGSWTEWGGWGQCLATPCTGAPGYTSRKRTCRNPQPKYNGAPCEGNTTETQGCINNENCPVVGEWCSWSNYTECRVGNTGEFKIKTRECKCPMPESGGENCSGIDFEIVKCSTGNSAKNRCRNTVADDEEVDETKGNTEDTESSGFGDDEC